MQAAATIARLHAALHRLDPIPDASAWNESELDGLLPALLVDAAVLVGVVPRAGALQVLLTRRSAGMRQHPGQVSFPGGRIEPGDADPVAAAVREAGEEVGLDPGSIVPLGYLDPMLTISGFKVWPVVAALTPGYTAQPDHREVDAVFEVPLDWLLAAENLRRVRVQAAGRPRSVLEFVDRGIAGQRIWGATASILYNLGERMRSGG